MSIHSIDDTLINSEQAERYFDRSDRRIKIGFRTTLELLGIPVPLWAMRKLPGRTPAKDVLQAYAADYYEPRQLPRAIARNAPRHIPRAPVPATPAPTPSTGHGDLFQQTFNK